MMDLAPILTGIAVAGLICQATAVPVPFKVEAILPQAEGAPYATMAAQIGKDMLASLLKRGDKLSFASSKNETTQGIYVGMEHSIGDTSFPLRLIRAQFPKLAVPPIGQPCYDSENRLVGIVLGVSRKGTCHLLPARAISFLATHPEAKRVRLGCLLDINSSTPVIEGLINGGPLARGGIQTGDILININDTPIRNYGDMLDATYYLTGDKPLSIEVIRGTQVVTSKGILPTQDPR